MKTARLLAVFVAISVASSSFAQVLLAGWDFQTATNGGTAIAAAPNTPTAILSNLGTQAGTAALYANGTNGSSSWTTATTNNQITSFAGTALNAGAGFSTITSGAASLGLVNGGSSGNGKALTFTLSMTGYEELIISYASQATGTGFNANQWSYSLNGSTFTNFGSTISPAASFSSITLSALSAVNGASAVWLKYTLSGATSGSGNNRLDNIQFKATAAAAAVPEPSTYAAIFGAVVLVGAAIHRRRQRAKAAAV